MIIDEICSFSLPDKLPVSKKVIHDKSRASSREIARHSTFEIRGKKMTTSTNLVSVHTNLLCVLLCVSAMASSPVVPCLACTSEPSCKV